MSNIFSAVQIVGQGYRAIKLVEVDKPADAPRILPRAETFFRLETLAKTQDLTAGSDELIPFLDNSKPMLLFTDQIPLYLMLSELHFMDFDYPQDEEFDPSAEVTPPAIWNDRSIQFTPEYVARPIPHQLPNAKDAEDETGYNLRLAESYRLLFGHYPGSLAEVNVDLNLANFGFVEQCSPPHRTLRIGILPKARIGEHLGRLGLGVNIGGITSLDSILNVYPDSEKSRKTMYYDNGLWCIIDPIHLGDPSFVTVIEANAEGIMGFLHPFLLSRSNMDDSRDAQGETYLVFVGGQELSWRGKEGGMNFLHTVIEANRLYPINKRIAIQNTDRYGYVRNTLLIAAALQPLLNKGISYEHSFSRLLT